MHEFTIADGENWVALGVFLAAAVFASTLASAARARAVEAERRRARGRPGLPSWLRCCSRVRTSTRPAPRWPPSESRPAGWPRRRSSCAPSAATSAGWTSPLSAGAERVGTLLVPRDAACGDVETLRRVAPSLAALLAMARRREAAGGRGGGDRGAAQGGRCQDGAAARDLARPALAADRHRHGRGRARRTGLRRAGRGDPLGVGAPLPPGRRPARPVAPRDRRGCRGSTGARSRR